jgi:hypothetical protein
MTAHGPHSGHGPHAAHGLHAGDGPAGTHGPQAGHGPAGTHGPHHAAPPADLPADLAAVLAEIVPPGGEFRHREHIHLAYLAVRRHGVDRAAEKVSGWIRHLVAYQRAPQKFNATVTRAWTEIVAHHMAAAPQAADFASFAARHPALLDKRLLTRHYTARALASPAARAGWVEPDVAPFPWRR